MAGVVNVAPVGPLLARGARGLGLALPIFLDAALKGALLIALGGAVALLLRRRSAAARHAAWTAAVVAHLAIPVLTLAIPGIDCPLLPTPPWLTVATLAAAPTPGQASPISAPELSRGLALLSLVWLTGAVAVLLRLALGTWRVARLAAAGARVDHGPWRALAQRVSVQLGMTRPVTLLRSDRLTTPITWGVVSPVVILPPDADEWPEVRRRMVLVHEMAHVRRFDTLTQLLAQLVLACFWFDPLLWVAARSMRAEREYACDNCVLRDGAAPSLYAGELVDFARRLGDAAPGRPAPAFAALAMTPRPELEGRVRAILDPGRDRRALAPRSVLLTASLVVVLTAPLAALRPFRPPAVDAAAARDVPARETSSPPLGDPRD